MVGFPEPGQRHEAASMQYSRGSRISDESDSAPMKLGTKQIKMRVPAKVSLAEFDEGVKDCLMCHQQY